MVKTQGRRGEVAAEILSDVPDRFAAGMKLLALPRSSNADRRELEVEELWPHKGLLVLKFAGVDSISEAEALVGCELQVPRSQRSELQAGWNYVSDLVGCAVLDHGREIGRIEDVQFGAGEAPLLMVRDAGGRLVEIPFAEAYLDSVDVERKQVRMKLPEGLLEVNAPLTTEEKREQAQPEREKALRQREITGKASVVTVSSETEGSDSAMKADIVTIFPDFFRGPLDYGITRRAQEMGLAEIKVHDLREFTRDRHRTVDDRPFGGGEGMVLKPEPLFECLESMGVAPREERLAGNVKQSVILLSAQGQRFTQKVAAELALLDRIVLVCGRYEGVDERVADFLADRELSIGDYVLSGGEMAAAVIVEAVMRLLPGAVGNETSTQQESFTVDRKNEEARTLRIRLAGRTDCWIIRTTRGPRSFAGSRCRKS